ncbi:MAG: hypothetical protein LAT65_08620 [Saccharospirillum sp.]|nr:hypothetical protein [Saccharospirillum sp.]
MDKSPARVSVFPANTPSTEHETSAGLLSVPVNAVLEEAIQVVIQGDLVQIPFSHCLTSLSAVHANDKVLVQFNGAEWFALGRCMRKDERPLPLRYDLQQGLRIETPQGRIQIDADGKVRVSGGCIVMRSDTVDIEVEDQARLTGPVIRLG